MRVPPTLRPGDRIAIAATARKVSMPELAPAIALLEKWGLEVVLPEGLFEEENQLAGTDQHRARLLQRLLDDPTIKAILCARGGYGTVRIIDLLDWTGFLANPKWIIGYSDVTVLHSHIHRHCDIATLHATMPINIPADALTTLYPSTSTMHDMLFQGKLSYSGTGNHCRAGLMEAPVVGGNLSMLYSLCGSPSDIDTTGKILFIEDLDEYLYHIDRMVQNLKRCGHLAGLKGLIVGAMSDMHDNTIPFGRSAEEIIWDAVKDYDYPVLMGAPFGHISTDNKALPLGILLSVTVSESGLFAIKKVHL